MQNKNQSQLTLTIAVSFREVAIPKTELWLKFKFKCRWSWRETSRGRETGGRETGPLPIMGLTTSFGNGPKRTTVLLCSGTADIDVCSTMDNPWFN